MTPLPLDSIALNRGDPDAGGLHADRAAIFAHVNPLCKCEGHTRAMKADAPAGPTLALDRDQEGGLVVTGAGFRSGERVTILVKTVAAARQVAVDQDGSFRVELGALATARGGALWVTAAGDRGSRATLVLPLRNELH